MSAPELAKVARPRVDVVKSMHIAPDWSGGRQGWLGTCFHCPWQYFNTVKGLVEWQARNHRADHRHASKARWSA